MRTVITMHALFIIAALSWLVYKTRHEPLRGNVVEFNLPKGTKLACFAGGKPYWMGEAK